MTEQNQGPDTMQENSGAVISSASKPRCYTVEDIMEILDISRPTVYSLIETQAFHAVRVGTKYRISRKSFDAWLDGC